MKKLLQIIIFVISLTFIHKHCNAQQYNVSGNAYSGGGQGCYILTNTTGQSGAVWNVNTINLNQAFDLSVRINFGSNDLDNYPSPTCGADGISFVLQPNGTGVFGIGGGVGFSGIIPSFGVIMDTYENGPDDNITYDQAVDHMSVSKNGSVIHGNANELVPPSIARNNGFPNNIEDGLDHIFRFVWTPASGSGTAQVYFDGTLMLTYTGNLITGIFGGNPVVYWGFSGSTGGCWNVQKVCINISANFSTTGAYCANQLIQFNNTSTSGATINSWQWNFGDGSPVSNLQNPTHTYTTAGAYPVTLIVSNIAGFSDTLITNITISSVNVGVTSLPQSICAGQTAALTASGATTFSWQPGALTGTTINVSPTATTIYTVTGTTTGCTDTDTITLQVKPKPQITTLANPVSICIGDTSILTASSSIAGTTYNWLPGNVSGSTIFVSPTSNTSYSVTGTANGCSGSSSVSVVVNSVPVVTATAIPDTLCIGQSTNLLASSNIASTQFHWMPGNLSGDSIIVSPNATTIYTLTGTMPSGCSNTATVTVVVNSNQAVSASVNPTAVCDGDSAILIASNAISGSTFNWMPGNISGNNVTVIPAATTVYTVYATTPEGCTGSASVNLTLHEIPQISAVANPTSLCSGGSSMITGSSTVANTIYHWMPGNLSGALISVSPSSTTVYSVTGEAFGCTGSTQVTVSIIPAPEVHIMASPKTGCSPLKVFLNYQSPEALIDSTCVWHFGDPQSDTLIYAGVASSHIYEKGGNYIISFSALTSGLCPVSAFDTIHVNPQPIADFVFSPDYASMENPLIQFNDQSIYPGIWLWNFGDDASNDANFSTAMNPWHLYSDTGYYPVQLILMNGSCTDTILKWLYVYEDDLLFVPNAFSPNGDGKNDVFRPAITGIDETAYELYIFDRWGKLVFMTKKSIEGWDGKVNGKYSESGIYVYTIKYKEVNGLEKSVKGFLTLVR